MSTSVMQTKAAVIIAHKQDPNEVPNELAKLSEC